MLLRDIACDTLAMEMKFMKLENGEDICVCVAVFKGLTFDHQLNIMLVPLLLPKHPWPINAQQPEGLLWYPRQHVSLATGPLSPVNCVPQVSTPHAPSTSKGQIVMATWLGEHFQNCRSCGVFLHCSVQCLSKCPRKAHWWRVMGE